MEYWFSGLCIQLFQTDFCPVKPIQKSLARKTFHLFCLLWFHHSPWYQHGSIPSVIGGFYPGHCEYPVFQVQTLSIFLSTFSFFK